MLTSPEIFDVAISVSALASLIVAVFKLHNMERDLRLRTLLTIKEVNRELITQAFRDQDLLDLLDGREIKDKRKMRRFYQIWLNQIEFTHSALARSKNRANKAFWSGYRTDAAYFLSPPHFVKLWEEIKGKDFYSPRFEQFIDELIRESKQTETKNS